MTPEEIAALRHEHRRWGGTFPRCKGCGKGWPCQTLELLDALEVAEAESRWLTDVAETNQSAYEHAVEGRTKAEAELARLREGIGALADGMDRPHQPFGWDYRNITKRIRDVLGGPQ